MIEVKIDPEINGENPDGRGARVTLRTRDGRILSHRVDNPKDHCRSKDTGQDLGDKWQGNLADCYSDALIDLGIRLMSLDDIGQLSKQLSGVMR